MFSFILTVLTTKNSYSPHKPDHVRTSPNTIFSDSMYRIKAQFSENCLKMLRDQKWQKTERLKF